MEKYALGIDIGGTTVKMGLFSQDGRLLDKWEIPVRLENKGAGILPDVAESLLSKMREKGIKTENLAGIGAGIPGAVDKAGNLVGGAVNLGWEPFNIPKVLRTYIEVPVKAVNDANAAAFGEMWQGGGKGYDNLVMVTLGTGVGGGIIVDGSLLVGAFGGGGEIGHIHIDDQETECCGCKNKGCLEQYASATGVVRLAQQRLKQDDAPSLLRRGELTAKSVFDAVKAKDSVALEVAERFGSYLGKGLANVANVVNPEIFVIGGGMSQAGEILLSFVEPEFQKYVFPACREVVFTLAKLGNDAGIYGAAGLLLNG